MERSIRELMEELERHGYVADRAIGTALHLSLRLEKPLLVEGEAGVGKTEIAKVLAEVLGSELIRLQCYEGLDVHTALYEWNYQKQLLRIRMEGRDRGGGRVAAGGEPADGEPADGGQADGPEVQRLEETVFSREYLLERPLLRAITREEPPILLIDEIDRADEEFEAFLLELLSDFQVTIPELGTVEARSRPRVVLTSNGTRELSDALRRRCLYLWIEHPTFEKELAILRARVPDLVGTLDEQVSRFVQRLREEKLYKTPGVAETLDWATALRELGVERLEEETVRATLGCLLKDRNDVRALSGEDVRRILGEVLEEA